MPENDRPLSEADRLDLVQLIDAVTRLLRERPSKDLEGILELRGRLLAQHDDVRRMPMSRDEFMSMIGEGVHTGLRKAVDSAAAGVAWHAIRDLPGQEWNRVLDFVADGFEHTYKPLRWNDEHS